MTCFISCNNFLKAVWRGIQDVGTERHGEHLLQEIHQNTSIYECSHKIPTEHWQKTSYNQSCKWDHHITSYLVQNNKKEKIHNWTYGPGRELCMWKSIFIFEISFPSWEVIWGRHRPSKTQKKGEASILQLAEQMENSRDVHGHFLSLRCFPIGAWWTGHLILVLRRKT